MAHRLHRDRSRDDAALVPGGTLAATSKGHAGHASTSNMWLPVFRAQRTSWRAIQPTQTRWELKC